MIKKIKWLVKRLLPEWIKKPLRKALLLYYKTGRTHQCALCSHKLHKFVPLWEPKPINIELKILGTEVNNMGECPYCRCRARLRLFWLYLSQKGEVEAIPEKEILHFAPEEALFKKLHNRAKRYVCCDMDKPRYSFAAEMELQDITQLTYPDASFDWVICSHVLEHIPDDQKAMHELLRVLRPKGVAFLMVPISMALSKTREDPTVTTPEEREKVFGQYDHVRVYTRSDFIARLEAVGFKVTPSRPTLSDAEIKRYGVIEKEEEIFVVEKR